jgi:hypothetical protein
MRGDRKVRRMQQRLHHGATAVENWTRVLVPPSFCQMTEHIAIATESKGSSRLLPYLETAADLYLLIAKDPV